MMAEHIKNNYLEGPAAEFVKRIDDIDEIWVNLKKAFGDSRVMLHKKLGELETLGSLGKMYNAEKIKNALNKLVNVIHDLMKIAEVHHIEDTLYNNDSIFTIYRIMGDARVTRFIELEKTYEQSLSGKDLWERLVAYLEKDIKIQLEKSMIYRTFEKSSSPGARSSKDNSSKDSESHYSDNANNKRDDKNEQITLSERKSKKDQKTCFLCNKDDHVATKGPYGKKLIQYFSCETFVKMSPAQRFAELKRKGLCYQCLFPGAKVDTGKHVEGKCQSTYKCKNESHDTHTIKKHVLVCEEHKNEETNKSLLEEYRTRCITRSCNTDLPNFAKEIQLSFHCVYTSNPLPSPNNFDHDTIYMFQRIKVKDQTFLLFFDNGCSEIVMTHDAVKRLGANARQVYDGTVSLGGVGGVGVESPYGAYEISLPLASGQNAIMSGLVIERLTDEFPTYTLNTDVQKDIVTEFVKCKGDVNDLPKLIKNIGGQVDIMIGVKYLRYYPKEVFMLLSGLTLYCSPFASVDRSRGVVAGPHEMFTKVNNNFYTHSEVSRHKSFFTLEAEMSRNISLDDLSKCCCLAKRNIKSFDAIENAGSEISYRCVSCRKCTDCKNGERIEVISIKEEVEQVVLEKSVKVNLETKTTNAVLPFMEDPLQNLVSNKSKALVVYKSQIRKLNNDPQSKADVLASEGKLQQLGFVDYVKNLTNEQRTKIFQSALQYFIPWRAVWHLTSITTPCRVVFDASMPTSTGKSLNHILAKGKNTMNKLIEIVIRWFMRRVGFHNDVRKMYNTLKLDETHWCYQLYLWSENLDPDENPEIKVIKTAMYGLVSSGNQAEFGLRETARLQKAEYPRAFEIVHNDIYVDDCLSGEDTLDNAHQSANNMEASVLNGGYKLKEFTFSGSPPPSDMSVDGKFIRVMGIKWDPEEDLIQLDISELNFSKKQRGRKSDTEEAKKIPSILTHSICLSKVCEIYDIVGLVTPITAGMKIDLHDFVVRGVKLKDQIPDDLRPIWESHFEMMKEINSLQYKRCIVPEDAISLDIDTIDTGDASQAMACVAIYARFARRNGEYSCQLVFGRSKLIPDGTTQPRCETVAGVLNTHTGEVVRRSFGSYHKSSIKLSDSQILLHWIYNDEKALKVWVRTRVIEILRFTLRSQWYFVDSENLIADLGTRKGAKLADVDKNSKWINGKEWMGKEKSAMPIKSISELRLSETEKEVFRKELYLPYVKENDLTRYEWPETKACMVNSVSNQSLSFHSHKKLDWNKIAESILKRYEYSSYLLDPNRHSFSSVVRIMSIVFKYVQCLRNKVREVKVSELEQTTHNSQNIQTAQITQSAHHTSENSSTEDPTVVSATQISGVLYPILSLDHPSRRLISNEDIIENNNCLMNIVETATYIVNKEPQVVEIKLNTENKAQIFLTDEEMKKGKDYYFRKASAEVLKFASKASYESISTLKGDILYYTGRILPNQSISVVVDITEAMQDLASTSFFVPVVDLHSPVAYSVVNDIHWNHKVARHSGVETVHRYVLQQCFIIDGRNLVKKFRGNCARCRYLAKRTIDIQMGPVSSHNLTIAPAYYITQVDIAGPFPSYSPHNKRTVVKIYFVVYCCATTSSVNLKVMEDYSSAAFLESFIRFSSEVGYPKMMLSDEGSQLVKGYGDMCIDFADLKNKLHVDMNVEFELCPVGGHNMIGRVERTIKEVKASILKSFQDHKFSILQWETVGAEIANTMNDLPLALGNIVSDFEYMDLITPNRLKLGRNNNRSPVGVLDVTSDPRKFFTKNKDIFNSWFNAWLISHVPKLMTHPKWFKTNYHIQTGDVVLFLKKEGPLNSTYQYGIVKSTEVGRDTKIRCVIVEYRNHNEEFNRETRRAVRELVVIHRVDELSIIREIGKIATIADIKKRTADQREQSASSPPGV